MNTKIKMSDVFNLPVRQNDSAFFGCVINMPECKKAIGQMNSVAFTEYAIEAINAYDALSDELTELTQLLADEREKANARIEELEGEIANMVEKI